MVSLPGQELFTTTLDAIVEQPTSKLKYAQI